MNLILVLMNITGGPGHGHRGGLLVVHARRHAAGHHRLAGRLLQRPLRRGWWNVLLSCLRVWVVLCFVWWWWCAGGGCRDGSCKGREGGTPRAAATCACGPEAGTEKGPPARAITKKPLVTPGALCGPSYLSLASLAPSFHLNSQPRPMRAPVSFCCVPLPLLLSSPVSPPAPPQPLTAAEAFHMATAAGAEVLGLGGVCGNFEGGKQLDALVVDLAVPGGPVDLLAVSPRRPPPCVFRMPSPTERSTRARPGKPSIGKVRVSSTIVSALTPPSCASAARQPGGESAAQRFEKFIFLGDDRSVKEVWEDGRQVK